MTKVAEFFNQIENENKNLEEQERIRDKKVQKIVLICCGILLITTIASWYYLENIEQSNELTLQVTTEAPFALSYSDYDYVLHYFESHIERNPEKLQDTAVSIWSYDQEILVEIQNEIISGAKQNKGKISPNEYLLLEMIDWSLTKPCSQDPTYPNCSYFEVLLAYGLHEKGLIDDGQFWDRVIPYTDDETKKKINENFIDKGI